MRRTCPKLDRFKPLPTWPRAALAVRTCCSTSAGVSVGGPGVIEYPSGLGNGLCGGEHVTAVAWGLKAFVPMMIEQERRAPWVNVASAAAAVQWPEAWARIQRHQAFSRWAISENPGAGFCADAGAKVGVTCSCPGVFPVTGHSRVGRNRSGYGVR